MKVLISIVCFTLLYCQSVNTKEWNGRTLKRFYQENTGLINTQTNEEYQKRFYQENRGLINTQINKEYQKRFYQENPGEINTQINKEYQKRLYYGINAKNVQVNENLDTQINHFSKKRFTQLNRDKILNGSTLTKRMNIKMIGPVVNLMSEQRGQSTGSGGLDLQTIGIVKNHKVLEDNTYQRPQPQNRFQPQYQQGQQNRNQQNNYVEYHKTNVHYNKEYQKRFNQLNWGLINTQINKEYQKRFNQVNSGEINTQTNEEYQKRFYQKNLGKINTQINKEYQKRFNQVNSGEINTQTNEEYQKRFNQANPGSYIHKFYHQ